LVVSSWAGPLSGGVGLGVGLGGATVDSVIGLERALLELEVGARVDELLARRANFGLLVGGKGELSMVTRLKGPALCESRGASEFWAVEKALWWSEELVLWDYCSELFTSPRPLLFGLC